jgi:hypothetical protein
VLSGPRTGARFLSSPGMAWIDRGYFNYNQFLAIPKSLPELREDRSRTGGDRDQRRVVEPGVLLRRLRTPVDDRRSAPGGDTKVCAFPKTPHAQLRSQTAWLARGSMRSFIEVDQA